MHLIEGWVRSTGILDMEALMFDQTDILRFCRARKFKEIDVKAMMTRFGEWYEAENVSTLYDTWDFPELPAVKAALPHGMHKYDKVGRPIYIRKIGETDFDAFFASSTNERLVRYITWQMEYYKYHAFPVMSRI